MERERNRRIFYASGVGLAQRIAQLLTSLVMLPVVMHELGVREFGVWGAATSLAWLSGMLDLGIGSSLLTLLPQVQVTGEPEQARRHVMAALSGGCVLALVVLVIGCASIMAGVQDRAAAPLLVAVVGLAINVPLSMSASIWFGMQKGHVAGGWEFLQTLLVFACLIGFAALHENVTVMVAAVYAPMVLVGAASLVHLLVTHPELRPRAQLPAVSSLRLVLGKGGMIFAITVAYTSSYAFDNVLALQWLGPDASAQAAVALRICTLAAGMFAVLTQPLWPAFVEAVASHDQRWAIRTLVRGTAATAALAAVGSLLFISYGGVALQWWLGGGVQFPAGLLWAIAAWVIVLCTPRVASLLFNAASILRYQLVVAIIAVAMTFALKPVLAGRFGVAGVVASAPLGWLLIVWPAYAWLAARVRSGRQALVSGPHFRPPDALR